MADVKIKVDTEEVEQLGSDLRRASELILRRATDRGEQLLREEVPKETGNLRRGVSSDVDVARLRSTLSVAARTGRVGPQSASLHLPSGKTVEIDLRSRPAFDYAEAVARGTGIYGPKHVAIRPKFGQALLIPVAAPPAALNGKPQAYITSGGQVFILRRHSKGRRPNPYDVRAAQRLEREVDPIVNAVVQAFANQEL